MNYDLVSLRVKDGHVTLDQPFVYCWLHPLDRTVIYVGATWLHPAARAELHLHSLDPDTRIVGDNLARLGLDPNQEMRVLAFPISHDWDRQTIRRALIAALARETHLSEVYFGPTPDESPDYVAYQAWTEGVIETIRASQL